jgi:hypothetical protein
MDVPQETKTRPTVQSSNTTLLGIYLKEQKPGYNRATPMFTAALSTITKLWEQPQCPETDELFKKIWYIHNGVLFSHKEE